MKRILNGPRGRRSLPFAAISCFILAAAPSRAELIHGTATFGFFQAIDFSTQSIVSCNTPTSDACVSENVIFLTIDLIGYNDCTIAFVPDSTLEAITTAPMTGYHPTENLDQVNKAYVARTGDGFYAKFAPRSIDNANLIVTIEYYVQMDGSPSFGPSLPTASTTWGRIKALYR